MRSFLTVLMIGASISFLQGVVGVLPVHAAACSGTYQGDVLQGTCKASCDLNLQEYDVQGSSCSGSTPSCCGKIAIEEGVGPAAGPSCGEAAKTQFGPESRADCYTDEKECKDKGLTPFKGGNCSGVCCYGIPKDATPTSQPSSGSPIVLQNPLGAGATLYTVINRVISAFLGMVGALALLVFVWAGLTWMTAGSSDRVQKAKDMMKYAVIGLAMIAFAYGITNFFIDALTGNVVPKTEPAKEYALPPEPNP